VDITGADVLLPRGADLFGSFFRTAKFFQPAVMIPSFSQLMAFPLGNARMPRNFPCLMFPPFPPQTAVLRIRLLTVPRILFPFLLPSIQMKEKYYVLANIGGFSEREPLVLVSTFSFCGERGISLFFFPVSQLPASPSC